MSSVKIQLWPFPTLTPNTLLAGNTLSLYEGCQSPAPSSAKASQTPGASPSWLQGCLATTWLESLKVLPGGGSPGQCWVVCPGIPDLRNEPRGDATSMCRLWARPATAACHGANLKAKDM